MKRIGPFLLLLVGGCTTTQVISALDGPAPCTVCHTNITNAHAKALVLCTDCHGQNTNRSAEQVQALVDNFNRQEATYGDSAYQALLDATHVPAKNPGFFLANGQSGSVGACFNGATDKACNGDDDTGLGTVDDAIDSEYARDVNYLRFINPGDLRVAHASCGGGNPREGEYGGCHTEEVKRVRRSIMSANAAVVTAAYLGNQNVFSPRGYMFDLDGDKGVDSCWVKDKNAYDKTCLTRADRRTYPDDTISAGLDDNSPGAFEVFPGVIKSLGAETANRTRTLAHEGEFIRLRGFGGQPLEGTSKPHEELRPVDQKPFDPAVIVAACAALPILNSVEPVGAILRGFRAYYPQWLPGTGKNFNGIAGVTLDPIATGLPDSKAFNPFGRGHGSGCTSCHMQYDNDGRSHEHDRPDGDQTLKDANRFPATALRDGLGGAAQGMSVLREDNSKGVKQQRFYPSRHRITSRVTTQQCGLCHTFVTRIDLAYQGIAEVEEGELLARRVDDRQRSGDITFRTPLGTEVVIYDNQERVDQGANKTFKVTTDPRAVPLRKKLKEECGFRGINCDAEAIYSNDLNGNGELDPDEPRLFGEKLMLPDRIPREASVDGRQARILYGGATGSQHLKDVHFKKGMHCIDCHFYQDLHGDGNIYSNNWDQIEIECEDCHGFSSQKAFQVEPGKLLTSGPNGGNDLMRARDELGRAFFEVRKSGDGTERLFQRSRVNPLLEWEVKQVADATIGTSDLDNPHSAKHVPTGPREGGKLECYSCHNTFAMNCLSCHYQQNYNQGVRQQKEVFLTGGLQSSHTNFQLFGMIRGPLILAVDGDAEHQRIAPFRSSMEAYVSLADCSGNTTAANVVHSNCRHGQPISGVGMNNFMPHSVGEGAARGCETCHTATNAAGHVVNNHLLAQTLGLGTGRINYLGDWLFVASEASVSPARPAALDIVDVKNESELPCAEINGATVCDTGPRNSFPGFLVGNANDTTRTLLRSFAVRPAAGLFAPRDVVLVRGFNGNLCTADQPLNPDIAAVAAGTGGLQVFNVSSPDTPLGGGSPIPRNVLSVPGNVVGVDHAAPDLSDPILYVADATLGFETVDLTGFNVGTLGVSSQVLPAGRVHTTPGWPAATPANGVKIMGTTAVIAAGSAGLAFVNVANPLAPVFIGTFELCAANEPLCTRVANRVTTQGTVAYVATGGGLVTVDVANPAAPRLLKVVSFGIAAEDVALSGHLAFVAAGTLGLKVLDVTDPEDPITLSGLRFTDQNGSTVTLSESHGVVIGAVPTQTWAFVADGKAGVRAVNVSTLFDPIRGRPGGPAGVVSEEHRKLTLEFRDPFSTRDTRVAIDELPVITFPTVGAARVIARGAALDRLADESGRRLRDSWNPGNGVLGRAVMDRMRATRVPIKP